MNDSSPRLERPKPLDIVIAGGGEVWHALGPALRCRRHRVTFVEGQEAPDLVRDADAVIVCSTALHGAELGRWVLDTARGVRAYYDLDAPHTLMSLDGGETEPSQISAYDLYLSTTGGPALQRLETVYGARRARTLYPSVDPESFMPAQVPRPFALGYLGERTPALDELLIEPARRRSELQFVLAGSTQPQLARPSNVSWRGSVLFSERPAFYCAQRFTLSLTPPEHAAVGFSPPARLFEAAACGVPIVSDDWSGLGDLLAPEREILLVRTAADVLRVLDDIDDLERERIAVAARRRVLASHSADHRAVELVELLRSARVSESQ